MILLSELDKLQPGMYIVRATTATGSCQEKLVKANK
jgi:hypothetical protein